MLFALIDNLMWVYFKQISVNGKIVFKNRSYLKIELITCNVYSGGVPKCLSLRGQLFSMNNDIDKIGRSPRLASGAPRQLGAVYSPIGSRER
jgi:hypothetical protein